MTLRYVGPLKEKQSYAAGFREIGKYGLRRLTELPAWAKPEYQRRAKQFGEIRAPKPWYSTEKVGRFAAEAMIPFAAFGKARKGFKAVDQGAAEVDAMYDRATQAFREMRRPTPRKIFHSLRRKFVDVSGNVKRQLLNQGDRGKQAVIYHDLIAGADSRSSMIFNQTQDDIFGGLNKAELDDLNRYIQSRRTIQIEERPIRGRQILTDIPTKQGKLQRQFQYTKKRLRHPEGFGYKEHVSWIKSLAPVYREKLEQRAAVYFKAMRNQLDALFEEGIIDRQAYEAMKDLQYSPRQFIQYLDPDVSYYKGLNKITVPDSGIKALKTGSEQYLERDASLLLGQVIHRTQRRIAKNRANKALWDMAEKLPENGIVRVEGKGTRPAGEQSIKVMIDGKAHEMWMKNEWAREWIERDPSVNYELANWIGWLSGGKILRPMATGINPEFALSNFPRDVAHIWLTTQEYSPTLPKFLTQFSTDALRVSKDAILRKGRWLDYIDQGGGMEFLTHQGQSGSLKGTIGNIQKVLGYLGETSEVLARLALRERALLNGATADEATWIARNYLDFSQGGSWAKGFDTALPYFNAGIQGSRGIIRSATDNPVEFTYKAAQIGALASGLYLANKHKNPEAWEQISPRDKINNWIITTPFSYTDKDGNRKYIYFKIAKDQGQRVLASVFEGLMAKYMGDEVDGEMISQAAADFIPIIPTEALPPSFDALLGYAANKDFWRMEDIWKGPQVEAHAEQTKWTHPAYVEVGKFTGLSPERIKYALSQYFTYGNIYTSLVGHGYSMLTQEWPQEIKDKATEDIVLSQPFIRRLAKSTNPYWKHGKDIKEQRIEDSTQRYLRTLEFDRLSQKFHDKEATQSDLTEALNKIKQEHGVDEKVRLQRRHRKLGKLQGLPNRKFWLELSSVSNPEVRAKIFWNTYRNASIEDRELFDKQLRQFPNITSKRFRVELFKLKKKKIPKESSLRYMGPLED